MPEKKKRLHLICNSHIDPVWLWEWQEGAGEAISTFRTAAEICEENGSFIFNHNEVILYKWIQEYDPGLFKRIQKLVKAGQWHIMGGWFLQPDCNMPCGESFVRQILSGRVYFKKYFNVKPSTAINLDPFGHSRGLVQILAKSGYDSYLFGRPEPVYYPLPADEFVWVGFDGSQVTAYRFGFPYLSEPGKGREKIEKWIKDNPDKQVSSVLWGMGNHGGGPSRKDIRDINALMKKNTGYDIKHSTPERFFKDVRRNIAELARHKKSLNPWSPGCYTSQVRIKQKLRQLESEFYSAEKMVCTAVVGGLMKYPYEQIHEVMRDLMMGQFHDILPGSSVQPIEEYALKLLDHGLETAARIKTSAFFALNSGQRKAQKGQIPVMVYNSHPFKVKMIIECEFHHCKPIKRGNFAHIQAYCNGRPITTQVEMELHNLNREERKKTVFLAELEPGQMNRFDCEAKEIVKKPPPALKAKNGKITFKTKELQVVINTKTGLVDSYRIGGADCVGKNAFEPIVIKDIEDSWVMFEKSFREVAGRFKLMDKRAGSKFSGLPELELDSVRVIEDGPVRSIVEAVFAYGQSFICQHYKLPKAGTEIEIETRVYWNEKTRMLKLSVPVVGGDNKYLGQVAYGVEELFTDGTESAAQKWVAVVSRKRNFALTCINEGVYGSDFSEDGLRLTLLRSAAYSAASGEDYGPIMVPQDRFRPRMEQGERLFRLWFNGGKIKERLEKVDREALVKNEKPFVLSLFPDGTGKKPKPVAILEDDVVQITAVKRAEKNNDLIFRLFEPTGKKRDTVLSLPWLGKKIHVSLSGFEIKTLKINPKTGKCVETDLMEEVRS